MEEGESFTPFRRQVVGVAVKAHVDILTPGVDVPAFVDSYAGYHKTVYGREAGSKVLDTQFGDSYRLGGKVFLLTKSALYTLSTAVIFAFIIRIRRVKAGMRLQGLNVVLLFSGLTVPAITVVAFWI